MGGPASRLQQLELEISGRLRRVCAHMPADEFTQLVHSAAMRALKYEVGPEMFRAIQQADRETSDPSQPLDS